MQELLSCYRKHWSQNTKTHHPALSGSAEGFSKAQNMKRVSRLYSRSSCLPVVAALARLRLCSSPRTMKRCGLWMQLKTRGRFLKNKYFPAWVSRFAGTINPACFQHAATRGSILRTSILHCFLSESGVLGIPAHHFVVRIGCARLRLALPGAGGG